MKEKFFLNLCIKKVSSFFPVLISFYTIAAASTKRNRVHHSLKTRVIFNYFTIFFLPLPFSAQDNYIKPSITMVIPVFKKMSAVDFIFN